MTNRRLFALVIALAGTTAADAQTSVDTLRGLQAFGVQVKIALDQIKVGRQPQSKTLSDMEHLLMRLRDSSAGDAHLQRKYQSVEMLFANLERQAAHPAQTALNPDKKTRAQIDVEVVTANHGASCANALGISENLPVQLMLGQAGGDRSDAWFRYEPSLGAHVRFSTASAGADPALEVFDGCGTPASKIASNDDALGLDAALSVAPVNGRPVFLHLTNSGRSGRAMVRVATAVGSITGVIRETGSGTVVPNASIQLIDTNGSYTGDYAYSDPDGSYSIAVANAGDYYVQAEGVYLGGNYLPELYPAGACWPGSYGISDCDLAHAQTVSIASGAVSGINISLLKGQKIAGQIRDNSNQPLDNAYVELYDANDYPRMSAGTDSFGHYAVATLPPGSYKLVAQAGGYGWQMFNHLACGGALQVDCDLALAGKITVSNQDVSGVDFSLPVLAAIEGTVTGMNSQPPASAQVTVFDTEGNAAASVWTDTAGHYVAGPLVIANYRVEVQADGYFSQVFNGIDCATLDCSAEVSGATQVAITTEGQHAQANFQLSSLPSVSGHVQDSTSGLPLANVSIQAWSVPLGLAWPSNSTVTNSNGDYVLAGTIPGQYYLWAQSDDHVDQLYSGIDCEVFQAGSSTFTTSCDFGSATPLTIALGQVPGSFDFALDASAAISGRAVTRAEPGSDLPAQASYAHVYDANGVQVAQAAMDAFGNYAVLDLPAGSYFAQAQQGNWWQAQYVPQLWKQIDCPSGCDPFAGTPIPLAAGAAATGIDFDLVRLDAVVGRVTNTEGDPIAGAVIDLFDSGTGMYVNSGIADAQGYYVAQGYTESGFFVGTEAGAGYFDQVYAGISCPLGAAYYGLCPFTNAAAISLESTATQAHVVDFVLQSNDPIFANGFQ